MLPLIVADNDVPLVISASAALYGALRTPGSIVVNGFVDGLLRARSIHVSPSGDVTGTLVSETLDVEGRLDDADIFANLVILRSRCQVSGPIFCRALEVHEGALFEGSHRRHADPVRLSRVDEQN